MPWERAFRLGRKSLLVFRPAGRHFGHLNLEVIHAVSTARRNGSWLYLVEPHKVVNRTCFDLVIPGVRRLPNVALLDRFLNWYADRDTVRQEQAHAARQQQSRDPRNRELQRLRRKVGLPTDSGLLEKECRLRIALRVWPLRRKARHLARELERVSAASRKSRKSSEARRKDRKDKAAKARNVELKESLRSLRHEVKKAEQLVEDYQNGFVRACQRHPVDPSTFWTWPLYQWSRRRQARRDAAEARHGKLLVDSQGPSYHKRRLVAEMQPMHFRKADEERLAEVARRLGIAPDARIVTIHIRESGYKSGMKATAKLPTGEVVQPRDEATRSNTVDNYLPALRYLIDAGYTIVRLGDRTMTPLSLPSVVDLATHPKRLPELDYYLIGRSVFFIGSDSGPMIIPYMTGVPLLLLNATHIAMSWPIGPADLLVPKYVREAASGRFLSLRETCGAHHLLNFRTNGLYDYVELTPDDLLASVREMERRLHCGEPLARTALQARYLEALTEWMDPRNPDVTPYFRKWAADDGFFGHGTLAQFVVERDAEGGGWKPADPAADAEPPLEVADGDDGEQGLA